MGGGRIDFMQVHFGVEPMHPEWPSAIVCIGTFDGVHLGHQAVIRRAVTLAAERELPCVVVTFDRHPSAILAPDRKPPALASLEENLAEFADLGAAATVILSFKKSLSETSASEFLQHILRGSLKASCLVVGHDFALGRGREGSGEWLAQHIETIIVPPVELNGTRVSSSDVRRAVLSGNVQTARTLLGRPFSLQGVVVGGQKLGRNLGYPTVNLARSFDQALPVDGVYAGACRTPHGLFRAAISIGTRPTVEEAGKRLIEAFLLEYSGQALYGRDVTLRFFDRLRGQERYESFEALTAQIELDVAAAAQFEI